MKRVLNRRHWDVWTLARDLGSLGATHENRVAVLKRPKNNFDRAAFLELCATNRCCHLRAFREFELALTWLTSEQSTDEAAEDG